MCSLWVFLVVLESTFVLGRSGSYRGKIGPFFFACFSGFLRSFWLGFQKVAFGRIVSLSRDGRTLAIGVPSDSSSAVGINNTLIDAGSSGSGAVYVFLFDGEVWMQQA